MKKLTRERLKEVLRYDPNSGEFFWKSHRHAKCIGKRAGFNRGKGYRGIEIDYECHKEHRLAWFYMLGEWPDQVDHINHNKSDNRWINLRNADNTLNQENVIRPRKQNKTGYLGVYPIKGCYNRFGATIRTNGKSIFLGSYGSPEAAHEAYLEAKRKHHSGNTL